MVFQCIYLVIEYSYMSTLVTQNNTCPAVRVLPVDRRRRGGHPFKGPCFSRQENAHLKRIKVLVELDRIGRALLCDRTTFIPETAT
jgi:hypothetical protein